MIVIVILTLIVVVVVVVVIEGSIPEIRYIYIYVDVVCLDKLDSGTQHQYPDQPLQANSVRLFSRQRLATSCLCKGKWLESSESQTGDRLFR